MGENRKKKTSERLNLAFDDPLSYLILVINHGFYCVDSFCYACAWYNLQNLSWTSLCFRVVKISFR